MLKKLSDILKEHKYLYATGGALILVSRVAAAFLPHLSFLMLFLTVCGICTVIYGALLHLENSDNRSVHYCALVCRVSALILTALFIVSFIFIQINIVSAIDTTDRECDYIIVLGCGLNGDKLTLAASSRADAAVKYMKEHPDCTAVLCGGRGQRELKTEAQALYDYMRECGIDSKRMLIEERSTDTTENIRYARMILQQNGAEIKKDDFAVVTNDFHLYRSMLIMKKAGFAKVHPINGELPSVPLLRESMHIREYFSVLFEYLDI